MLLLCVSALAYAEPVIPGADFAKMLKDKAGDQGQFYRGREDFPKDYFLVPNNLPFLAGLSLHHPKSSTLKLSDKQIEAIKQIKKITVPAVVKKSKKIKMLELELAQKIAVESNDAESQFKLVDHISKLRTELTKAHLKCINEVRSVLSKEQYTKLLKYAAAKKSVAKSAKFRVDELIILPHPGRFIKKGQVKVSKEQKMRIKKEVKAVFPPIFQDKIREAFQLEKQVRRAVAKGKTKAELKPVLDKIAKLKREAMDSRIDALNKFKEIVNDEQWKKIQKLSYK